MKNGILILVAIISLLACPCPAADNDAISDLKDLVKRISADFNAGKRTEAEQADHIKEFDDLLAKYKGQNNDAAAEIAFMKANLYEHLFHQPDKAVELLQKMQHDFPDSAKGKQADQLIATIKQGQEAQKIAEAQLNAPPMEASSVPVGTNFPGFDVKDLKGNSLSLASYKGKVVMVDFWATWCGPCVGEVPNVAAVYKQYHDKGFEIIGVSLDAEADKDKLISFMKQNDMPWRQYFDGKNWQNDLAVKYGIRSIPMAFLLDGTGKVVAEGSSIRGDELEPAVAHALGLKAQGFLAEDTGFPDFDVTDLEGKPLSVAGYKGRVVMIDFWATWCGPCVGEVPNVAAVYKQYHDKGFDIIGVSLDQAGDKDKVVSFTKEHEMPWRQYYDGKGWQNDLAVKYHIRGIPATILLDGNGTIIGKNVRGPMLEPAVQKALAH
jgi:thiol-disulfide isomerase/thioredoxin